MSNVSAGARFRAAVAEESPLQVMGAVTAYAGLMASRVGYKALYLSGGGVAANSLGMPDLGISTMEDVLTDARRIVDATQMPLLVDIDTGWGGAFNIARAIRSFVNVGVAAVHMEDQVGQKRCGHRPGKDVVSTAEMVDRVKAADGQAVAVDAEQFAARDAQAVRPVLGALGEDSHTRPLQVAARVTRAAFDLCLRHEMKDVHDLEVAELAEPRKRIGADLLCVEDDRRLHGSPVVVDRLDASAADFADGSHRGRHAVRRR